MRGRVLGDPRAGFGVLSILLLLGVKGRHRRREADEEASRRAEGRAAGSVQ